MFNIEATGQSGEIQEALQRLSQGEEVTITREGRLVAKVVPVERPDRDQIERAVHGLLEYRKGKTLGGLSLKSLIEEGRP